MLALALDNAFQSKVQEVLAGAEVEHTFSRAEVKSYERMYTKMMSWSDHGQLSPPRAANNVDVIRCLVMFETATDMRRAFDVIPHAFAGRAYNKFKNGMSLSAKEVEESFYLRLVLGCGRFEYNGRQTMGELRSDPEVQSLWRSYVDMSTVPPFVDPRKWHEQATKALSWLNALSMDTPVFVHGEVQMVLRRYNETRNRMHELYKVVRAVDEKALDQDFGRHQVMFESAERYREDGNSELNTACRDGITAALPRLLSDVDAQSVGQTLTIGARYGRRSCVERLLSKAAEMGLTVASHAPQALVAVAKGDGRRGPRESFNGAGRGGSWFEYEDNERCAIARMLLEHGLDVNGSDDDSRTAIYWAAKRGYSNLVQLLITRNADVNLASSDGYTPLHDAANGAIARLLCNAGADLNTPSSPESPLDIHAGSGRVEPVKVLLECRANVHRTRPNGASALYMASQSGHAGAVRVLLDSKARVDQRKDTSHSPLAVACQCGHPEVAGMLMDAKADVNKVYRGWSAVSWAKKHGHTEVVDVILARKKMKKKRSSRR